MAAERLERRRRFTVGNVDLAVAGAATDQQAGLVGGVLEEAQIADRSVVHRQFDFLALELLLVLVEAHQLDRFVVGTGRDQVTHRGPRHAIDGALVVFRPLEEDRRLVRGVVFPGRVWEKMVKISVVKTYILFKLKKKYNQIFGVEIVDILVVELNLTDFFVDKSNV